LLYVDYTLFVLKYHLQSTDRFMTPWLSALYIAIILSLSGMQATAQNISVDQLRNQIESALSDSVKIELKLQLVDQLSTDNRQREVRQEIGKILRLSNISGYQKGYLEGLIALGDYYISREFPDSAMIPIREGMSQSGEIKYRMKFLYRRGTISRLDNQPIESIRFYNQALVLADSLNNINEKARINYNLSLSQRILGDYSSAFENLYRSLLQTEQARDSRLMAYVLNEIGELYHELGDSEEGIYYLEGAEEISRGSNLTENLIRVLINLGVLHRELGNFEEANRYLLESKSIVEEYDDMSNLVSVDYNLGMLRLQQGELETARDFFTEGLNLSREHNVMEGLFYNAFGLGQLEKESGNFTRALDWLNNAYDSARDLSSTQLISRVLEEVYELYRQFGQISLALETLESLKIHDDSVRTLERERSRAEYEALLESRRQEEVNRVLLARQAEQEARIQLQQGLGISTLILLAIVLAVTFILYRNNRYRDQMNRELKERNREISSKNEELDRLNNIKNKMFAVVAHDLRGPLSSLQSLLYLLREHDLSKDELDEITNSLEQSLHDNATTMENLLAWAKSQMSGINVNYRMFKLRVGAEAVISQVKFQAEQKEIEILNEIEADQEIYADYDMIKLIMRNIISNAVKFCKAGDQITIKAIKDHAFTTICIKDSGRGIREEDKSRIFNDENFTREGTKNEQGSGLGLALCKEFVKKHGGRIWFESEFGIGTEFSFTIPVKTLSENESEGEKESASSEQLNEVTVES
jgi:two-component system, sensor histidine kinase and response regulator